MRVLFTLMMLWWDCPNLSGAEKSSRTGVVYRFGIIGTVIMLLLIFSIARKGSMKYGFLLAAIALLIVAHRAYLMFSPAIYMMLLTAVYVNRTKESFIIKIEGLDK